MSTAVLERPKTKEEVKERKLLLAQEIKRRRWSPDPVLWAREKLGDVLWYVAQLANELGLDLDELAQRVTTQLDDLSRRQQAHAERVTQLLDQVMAELTRRVDALVSETRTRLDELKAKATELERRKLNVADFGASLATLGQRFAGDAPADAPPAG